MRLRIRGRHDFGPWGPEVHGPSVRFGVPRVPQPVHRRHLERVPPLAQPAEAERRGGEDLRRYRGMLPLLNRAPVVAVVPQLLVEAVLEDVRLRGVDRELGIVLHLHLLGPGDDRDFRGRGVHRPLVQRRGGVLRPQHARRTHRDRMRPIRDPLNCEGVILRDKAVAAGPHHPAAVQSVRIRELHVGGGDCEGGVAAGGGARGPLYDGGLGGAHVDRPLVPRGGGVDVPRPVYGPHFHPPRPRLQIF
mmetsp:Transcript_50010/g.160078  ORF Transcript_50010/g.160078 Transcript_50010/m.160078 type:complete len:247 (-) Transcript_50010:360-1100(-)